MRPDIEVVSLRGNVQTRMQKVNEGQISGTLLAMAGLKRLGLSAAATDVMEPEIFLPAPGQGAICVESRKGDDRTDALLAAINHQDTAAELACERAFLAVLDGSCRTPIAGLARVRGEKIHFRGMVLAPDGQTEHDIDLTDARDAPEKLGRSAGSKIRDSAGPAFFADWH